MADTSSIIEQAEKLHLESEFAKISELLKPFETSDDVELLWRLSRAHFDLADQSSDKSYIKEELQKALALADKVLALDDKHFAGYKWKAIILATLGDHVSTKEKIRDSFVVKENALRALELSPEDGTVCHLLGRWCYGVSSVGWVERKLASAIFGTPPTSSYEEALEYFLKADKLHRCIRNCICIGDTYAQLGQKAKAKEWFTLAASLPTSSPKDELLHKEACRKK